MRLFDVLKAQWDESKHPRHPAGSSEGGEFAPANRARMLDLPQPRPTTDQDTWVIVHGEAMRLADAKRDFPDRVAHGFARRWEGEAKEWAAHLKTQPKRFQAWLDNLKAQERKRLFLEENRGRRQRRRKAKAKAKRRGKFQLEDGSFNWEKWYRTPHKERAKYQAQVRRLQQARDARRKKRDSA